MKNPYILTVIMKLPTLLGLKNHNQKRGFNFIYKVLTALFLMFLGFQNLSAQSFSSSNLDFNGLGGVSQGTSLMFGPDGRLYVAQNGGNIDVFTIQRNGVDDYVVIASEEVLLVKNIPNHNDDGSSNAGNNREVTGITVAGTATNPIMYVTSSDSRVGGPSGDQNLDTNSGVITRLTWSGSQWIAVDIVRGLPRSEENHATNGLEFVTINGVDFLIVAQGGHTNAGSPSDNFAWTTEYALSAALLSVNLTMLEAMPILSDGGRQYIYDLPTLDDPTRANVGPTDPNDNLYTGVDVNDPFGGNDGLNQAMVVPGGPVQIFSAGYRNSYDLVVTEAGKVFATDNGANGGWGGLPDNEGVNGTVTNKYILGEPGSSVRTPDDDLTGEKVNNLDHLTMVTDDIQSYVFGSFYGGHPAPVRANPASAGLYTNPTANATTNAVFRTLIYDPSATGDAADPQKALPANWPPVPVGMADPQQGDWRGPGMFNPDGPNDILVTTWANNTNGIDEYTASNFGGAMKTNLIAGKGSTIWRVELDAAGNLTNLTENFKTNLGNNALGITCNGDSDPFPGTIWVASYDTNIRILEPNDFVIVCLLPGDPGYQANGDNDFDGYTNQDEIESGSDPCGGGEPADFDKVAGGTLVSDFNDLDDDNDGIDDKDDPFQLGNPLTSGNDAFDLPVKNELLSGNTTLLGYLGLGFTGLMNNGNANPNWLDWIDVVDAGPNPNDILGGAVGAMTIQMTPGTALGLQNNQEKAFQFGVNIGPSTGGVTVEGRMFNFTDPLQLYGSSAPTNGEIGLFIGDGTQSNYIKFVLNQSGLEARQEINDVPQPPVNLNILPGDRPTNDVVLFFVVDPAGDEVTLQYQFDGGPIQTLSSTIKTEGTILAAIQDDNIPLAVGLIGSSNTQGEELEGTWDYVYVQGSQPTIQQDLPDLSGLPGSSPTSFPLDNYFSDDGGAGNLTYSVVTNTNPAIGASVSGSTLNITFPEFAAESNITIRATDSGNLFVEQTFTVAVSDEPVPLIRIRANGETLAATDAPNPDWIGITAVGAQSGAFNGIGYGVNTGTHSNQNTANRDASVPSYVPQAIYTNERYDVAGEPEMEFTFDLPSGNYFVRLYMGNGYAGTSEVGQRIFDISIEGQLVQDNLDLVATFGHQIGGMIQYPVTVNDGTLNILFGHVTENPLINGIEILGAGGSFDPPISVNPIANQTNEEGDLVNLDIIIANGGDANENFSYEAFGLPPGMVLEPTTGNINGTIVAGAAGASPYTVQVTVDKPSSTPAIVNFTWTIIDPNSTDTVLYRINTGGALTASNDSSPKVWEEDQKATGAPGGNAVNGTPSQYVNATAADLTFGAVLPGTFVNTTGYPDALFATERYNNLPEPDNMQWSFPTGNGDFQVNLLFNENWANENANADNHRIFDVEIENQNVLDDYRPSVDGTQTNIAIVKSFQVSVSDGTLNIDFIQINENPAIKGIEIISASTPVSDVWTNVTNVSEHTPRHENSFVQVGDKFYLFGGRESADKMDIYDYQTNTWTQAASTAPFEFNHFQAVAYEGLIWVIGSFKDNGFPNETPADFIYMYDPVADSWIQGPEIPLARRRGSAGLVLYNDKFYVVAGNTDGHDGGYIAWFDEFDPATGEWTPLANTLHDRDHFHASVIGDKLYVVGGRLSGGPDGTFAPVIPEIDVYDFTTNSWSTLPSSSNLPNARAASGTVNFQGNLVVIGGEGDGQAYANTDALDVNSGTWTALDNLNNARHGTQAIVSGDGIWITSGSPTQGGGTQTNMEVYGSDNPTGTAVTVSTLNVVSDVMIPTGDMQTFTIENNGGNQGIYVTSLTFNGANASSFSILGSTSFLIPAGESRVVEVAHSGTTANDLASLNINYGSSGTSIVNITSDGDAPSTILYRVNAGGVLVAATDAPNPDWTSDTVAAASTYLTGLATTGNSIYSNTGTVIMTDPSLPAGTPSSIFQNERYDNAPAAPQMLWQFPVPTGTEIEVRLYFAEIYSGITAAGGRVFDVSIEGTVPAVYNDIDAFDRNGLLGAFMLSYTLTMTDGTLDIEFIHLGIENPAIKAIEIIDISNAPVGGEPIVTNPGAQVSVDGDQISLQIIANDANPVPCGPLTYEATNLPPNVTIDPATGLISGTLLAGSGTGTAGAYIESGGLVVIEAENDFVDTPNGWNLTNEGGVDFLTASTNHFGNTTGQAINYTMEISNPGVYRFHMKSNISGTVSSDENDSWFKINNTSDVHFFAVDGGILTNTAEFENIINGGSSTKTIYYPAGNAENRPNHGNENPGNSGYFKVYRSGGGGNKWDGQTIDNNGFPIYAYFPNAGTYTVAMSERSAGHKVDRIGFAHINLVGNSESTAIKAQLDGPQSQQNLGGSPGASEDSPYEITVNVTDNCLPALSTEIAFTWNVTATLIGNPAALVQVNAGDGLTASTFGNNSFIITNEGDDDIVNITINTDTAYMTDIVFDPIGLAGDTTAKCLTTGGAGNTAAQVGITVPADGGTDAADCQSIFAQPNNGVDDSEGYDVMSLDFTDFNPGESYAFGVDMDPTTIKGDFTAGDAGSVSGFELIGATISIEYASGVVYTSSLFDEGSLGGSDAIINGSSNSLVAPSILVDGLATSRLVTSASQTVAVIGEPNASVTLLRVDGRLYIDAGNPSAGYDIDLFEANAAMAKQLYTVQLDDSGVANIPVTLTQTAGASGTPNGGLNHFIAVVNGPSGENSIASNVIVLEFDPNAIIGPSVLVEITPDADLDSSTFGAGSIQVTNNSTGGLQITGVSIDLSTAVFPDMVFDPTGTGGDATAKCFEANTGAALVGLIMPADICTTPFSQPRQGGYDIMSIGFNQFDPGESFTFSVDIDPNSIQDVAGAGDAGSVSGFELVGATVTITFNDASTITTSIYEDGSLGGGQAIAALQAPVTPIISVVGVSTSSATVNDLNQTVTVTGTPGDVVSLMLMDSRLFIATGNPAFNVPDETYYANEAMDKALYTGLIGAGGTVDIPVVLLQTAFGNDTPEGGLNQIVAVTSKSAYAPDMQVSSTSNVITLLYDPNATTADITITAKLQARENHSGDYTVKLYEVGAATPLYDLSATADDSGLMMVNNIAFGTYELALKYSNSLQVVQTITIEAPTDSIDMGELLMGNTNVIDNVVSQVDFAILSSLLNLSKEEDPGYNPNADFNGDGFITLADFAVLLSNFNVRGQKPSGVVEVE